MKNLDKLSPEAAVATLGAICKALADECNDGEIDPDIALDVLKSLVNSLDSWDEEDAFGTEGWREFFSIDI